MSSQYYRVMLPLCKENINSLVLLRIKTFAIALQNNYDSWLCLIRPWLSKSVAKRVRYHVEPTQTVLVPNWILLKPVDFLWLRPTEMFWILYKNSHFCMINYGFNMLRSSVIHPVLVPVDGLIVTHGQKIWIIPTRQIPCVHCEPFFSTQG